MPGPFPFVSAARPEARGTLHRLVLDAPILAANPWGDPTARDVWVHVPAGVSPDTPLPAILFLPGFAGTPEGILSRDLGQPGLADRIDLLIDQGCPPFLAVLPDAMTTMGGSQFVDSPALGPYRTWLIEHVMPFVDGRFSTTGRWGAAGRSSGGYGAFQLAIHAPGTIRAIAMHAADCGFDLGYLGDIAPALRAVQALGGSTGLGTLPETFWASPRPSGDLFALMNLACMACAYAPTPGGPLPGALPFDPDTGEVLFDVLTQWQAHDPVRMARDPSVQQALSTLDLLFIDAGRRDEYGLHLGAQRLVDVLQAHGVPHVHEAFDGGHRGTAFRWDRSLPLLAEALHR